MVKVFIERENRNEEVKAETAIALLKQLKINPENVLIVRNNELVTDESKLNDKDEIKLLSVISGG